MLQHIIFIISTFYILGCKKQEDTQAKFIALAQRYQESFKDLLINKVHKSAWKIRYGFADNYGCGGKFNTDTARAQLTAAITKVLQTWLQALEHRGNIVQNFSYELDNTFNAGFLFSAIKRQRAFSNSTIIGETRHGNYDLAIIFYCRKHDFSFTFLISKPIELHIFESYRISTLLHEVGHAFGLEDTYVDNSDGVKRYNTSDGGTEETVGTQPLSVMNSYYLMAYDDEEKLTIGTDDHVGINWLYDFYQRKNINKDSCPPDYVYEPNTKGCTPRYQLIFAVKQARVEIVEKLLQEDTDIDLNQQDNLGNTAMHYAANLAGLHGRELYDLLINRGAKDTIKNKNNETAREILAGKHNKFVTTMFAAVRKQVAIQQEKIVTTAQEKVMLRLVEEFVANKRNNVNMQDKVGNTLLHYAAIYGINSLDKNMLDIFISQRSPQDIDVNAQARVNKETALHKAVRYRQPQFAIMLSLYYEDKIDLSIKDVWGKTALDRALYEEQQARSKGKTPLANEFKEMVEVMRELELIRTNEKQQSL